MRVKFLTLNIWKGKLLEKAIALIKHESPDILALQEVFNGDDPALPDELLCHSHVNHTLGYSYSYFSPECLYILNEGKIQHGNAIYSKMRIKEQRTIFFDVPFSDSYVDKQENFENHPRNLQHVVIQSNTTTLNVLNTHGIWELSGRDNERRLKMSQVIVDSIQDKENVILAGDFNLQAGTQTIRNIEQHLTNVFKDELTTTFNMKRKDNPDYGQAVVDMIFVSPNIKMVERYCPQVDVSDHLPLVCVFEL